jgi:cytosine/adenosine deaminase-related metal-dependent hydrolase
MGQEFQDKTISIHNQESAAENEFFMYGTGDLTRMYKMMNMDIRHFKIPATRSLRDYLPKLKPASKIILVHNTYMNEADLSEAQSIHENLFFCLCPNANRYIEDRLADILLFLKHRARIVLGTDSLASNKQLSILEEMKTIKQVFPTIPTTQLLVWATSNGAWALSFDDTLGGFSKGKRPGIVLLENMEGGEIHAESTARRII